MLAERGFDWIKVILVYVAYLVVTPFTYVYDSERIRL